MSLAIKVENLSKVYNLGEIGTGTLSRDIERWWALVRGKEDPYLRIGETNDRASKGDSNVVYSLQDLSFEVKQGEAVGIIGRNGAGKSTLLKILSRVTSPTAGKISIKGRIASLLEVGTGFHPELSGKDNIFLNGAIMGMKKAEIKKKLDEIIAFSGVERYVDTPVKRYSSGMYVRLAFAVAAHLQSEILIVDEVLAVGDAEFQSKCLGKMKDVSSNEGRTVLFVSHNMAAMNSLCTSGMILEKGNLHYAGDIDKTINKYLEINRTHSNKDVIDRKDRVGNQKLKFANTWVENANGETVEHVVSGQSIKIVAEIINTTQENIHENITIAFALYDYMGYQITDLSNLHATSDIKLSVQNKITITCELPSLPLNEGVYRYNLFCRINNEVADGLEYAGYFNVNAGDFFGTGRISDKNQGQVLFKQNWNIACAE
ncbi:ABC transporter ATP-binding protein [Chitinophagaceae bacterium IBVUCB1]|nr:ABC transporter ATP-binding protein [Chitinophagaceae bacterium IBVUCB1]